MTATTKFQKGEQKMLRFREQLMRYNRMENLVRTEIEKKTLLETRSTNLLRDICPPVCQ